MIQYLAGGGRKTTLRLFGVRCWVCLRAENCGWFRLFGIGATWAHRDIRPVFGGRKKVTIGSYRYGYLNF